MATVFIAIKYRLEYWEEVKPTLIIILLIKGVFCMVIFIILFKNFLSIAPSIFL